MNSMRAPVALVVLATLSLAGCSHGLTEATARDFVASLEASSKACDADAYAKLVAPDMTKTMQAVEAAHMAGQRLNRDQAIDSLRAYCASKVQVAYESQVKSVQMQPNGQGATVTLDVQSTDKQQGHELVQSGEQVYTLALRDGEPKLVAVNGTLNGLTVDGRKLF